MVEITPELLMHAYAQGIFPMAESADTDEVYWVDPELRGIFPLDDFHVPKKLAKTILKKPFRVTVNKAFREVISACAAPKAGQDRDNTWINDAIIDVYNQLHLLGYVHSIECWQDDQLVGGLYGVCFSGVFCGESMFHTQTDASKIALVYLVARLKVGGFQLLDTQFITPHLAQFGAIEVPRREYKKRLQEALEIEGDFYSLSADASPETILHSVTQIS